VFFGQVRKGVLLRQWLQLSSEPSCLSSGVSNMCPAVTAVHMLLGHSLVFHGTEWALVQRHAEPSCCVRGVVACNSCEAMQCAQAPVRLTYGYLFPSSGSGTGNSCKQKP
jgi:hypothetical protein